MAQSLNDAVMRAQFLAAAAALCYLVAILGAGGLDCYRLVIMGPNSGVWSELYHSGDLTAGAAPVGLRALFRTIRGDFLCRVGIRMAAFFRGLLPLGHPIVGLICFGHRVRAAVMTYIGHLYFCIVLDALLVSGKFILAVLDGTSVAIKGRSAIANGSARAITVM